MKIKVNLLLVFFLLPASGIVFGQSRPDYTYYTLEQIKERFDRYKIDSGTHLSEQDFLERIEILKDLKPSTYRTYKAAVAYFATPQRLKEISDINYGINSSIAIARNKITYMRERKADSTIAHFRSMPIERIYDFESRTFMSTSMLEEVKKYVFASSRKPNFSIHLIGKLLHNIHDFDVEADQQAKGYRMSLRDNYHLLIVDLPQNGRKMILFEQKGWDNEVKGVY